MPQFWGRISKNWPQCVSFIVFRHVLAGIIAFGIGCGNEEIPDVFASVHEALCFIDYDVKCKHGNKFKSHFDYEQHCSTWYDDEVSARTGKAIYQVGQKHPFKI